MMDQLQELFKQYWYACVAGVGILIVLGAIFKWKWVLESNGGRPLGFLQWILDIFGPQGCRIAVGTIGVIIILTVIYAAPLHSIQ